MKFTKMHGCGNDYVYIDAWAEDLPKDLPALARAVSDRHTGIGSDGLIIVGPSDNADARMTMFNADGSESEMCGNGIRCAAKLAYDHKRVRQPAIRFETGAGLLDVELLFGTRKEVIGASVLMGQPRLQPAQVPVIHPGPGPKLRLNLTVDRKPYRLLAVGMGNPHAVIFVDDPESFPVAKVGPVLERHPKFPRRTNVEFVARLPDEAGLPVLRQRTWERGAGETQACGTGACAVAVAAIIDGVIPGREATVRLNGGDLRIAWPRDEAPVRMTGEAVTVFAGVWSR
jgi:diaminopimelate epimerase